MNDCAPVSGTDLLVSPGLGWVWCDACEKWWPPTSVHATMTMPGMENR